MKRKQIFSLVIVVLFGGSFLAYALNYAMPSLEQRQRKARAYIQIMTCGKEVKLPTLVKSVNNRTFTSNSTGLITFPTDREFTLGKAFDLMNITFSKTQLVKYENDNECNTPYPNEVSVWIGEDFQSLKEINKYRSYAIKNGDVISVRYS